MRPRQTRLLPAARAAVISACCLLGLASLAGAQAGWSAVTDHGRGMGLFSDLAVDANGNVVAVWVDRLGGVVQVARYTNSSGTWTPAVPLSNSAEEVYEPRVAASAAGDAVAVWEGRNAYLGPLHVTVAHYAVATGTWSNPVELAPNASSADIVVDDLGNAIAVWSEETRVVKAARYDASGARWLPPIELASPALRPQVVIDRAGNATVVWQGNGGVESARYVASTSSWTATTSVARLAYAPEIAVDGSGNVIAIVQTPSRLLATWNRVGSATWSSPVDVAILTDFAVVEVATDAAGNAVVACVEHIDFDSPGPLRTAFYDVASDSWSAATIVAPFVYWFPKIAVDPAGNATMVWSTAAPRLQIARRPPGGQWTILTGPLWSLDQPQVAVDQRGNVTVLWGRFEGFGSAQIQSTRWVAAPAAPSVESITSGSGNLTISFSPPSVSEPAFGTLNYEYSVDDGVTWTVRTPASSQSPLSVNGLVNGKTYTLRLRAVNVAGAGVPSEPDTTTPGLAPPVNLSAVSVGNAVTFRWDAPAGGVSPTGYLLEGGPTPGSAIASLPIGGPVTGLTITVPSGVFYLRVRAVVGKTRSEASNEIQLVVNVPSPPSAPEGLLGLADGSDLTLAWQNTLAGGIPTGIVLDVAGDRTDSIELPLTDRFSFSGVPTGTYTFSVRAVNADGSSRASNAVTLTFPGTCSPPGMPTAFSASKSGSTIVVSWLPPAAGAAPTGYIVFVTGSFESSFSTPGLTLSGTAGPGMYLLSVAATNTCGTGAATATRTITIP
jgi:Fibronectin type III domain